MPANSNVVTPGPSRRFPRFSRKLAVSLAGGILLLALIGGAVFWWLDAPARVVREYYAALQAQDTERMRQCMDPDAPLIPPTLPPVMIDSVHALEKLIGRTLGVDVRLAWDFQNLAFTTLEREWSRAKVQVRGQVRVAVNTEDGAKGLTLPYDWTHEVVRKNGRWYLKAW